MKKLIENELRYIVMFNNVNKKKVNDFFMDYSGRDLLLKLIEYGQYLCDVQNSRVERLIKERYK